MACRKDDFAPLFPVDAVYGGSETALFASADFDDDDRRPIPVDEVQLTEPAAITLLQNQESAGLQVITGDRLPRAAGCLSVHPKNMSGMRLSEAREFRRTLRESVVFSAQSDRSAVAELRQGQVAMYSAVGIDT